MTLARQLLLSCTTWCLIASSSAGSQSATTLSADIAPQPLAQALTAFAQQTGLQLIYVSAVAGAQQSRGARAGLSPPEALTQLLENSGLQFEFLNARTVRIYAAPIAPPPISRVAPALEQHAARQPAARALTLEEVVVTATRREERASNVPISMVVWSQEAMEASGVKGMDEIGVLTPGVEFDFDTSIGLSAFTNLVIRGVTVRHGPTTGVYIDDTPVPIATSFTLGRSFPWAFDLDRVEVLRGPQGTLLGQGTLGGAVRFIMNQPSLTAFTGLARMEFSTTARGAGSYEAGVAAGGPLIIDVLGFRVSGWYQREGGFIDRINPSSGATVENNVNRQINKSVRGTLTWAPTGSVRITPTLDYESYGIHDTPTFYVPLSSSKEGELRSGALVQQPFDHVFYLASVKVNSGFTSADLNSVTSYFHRRAQLTFDYPPPSTGDRRPAEAVGFQSDYMQRVFTQEIRLASTKSADTPLFWITGAFYSSERKHLAAKLVPAQGPAEDGNPTAIDQTDLEGFGQIGLRITNRLTTSAGLRIGHASYDAVTESSPIVRVGVAESAVTPRFELSYQTDIGNLWYATAAKGYRSGGFDPDPAAPTCGATPNVFAPDTVWSYEIGAKRDLLAGRVHVEPSVFHIQWHNQQPAPLVTAFCGGTSVGSTAASDGFDLAAQLLLNEAVKVNVALAYTDAHYTRTLRVDDKVIVRQGDKVRSYGQTPSPWNVTTSIEYKHAVTRGVAMVIRAEDVFHSRNPGPFEADNPESPYYSPGLPPDPSTNQLNLRAGLRWPSFDLTLFATNALDARPTLLYTGFQATTLRPRTIGLSGTWRFDRSPHSD